MRISATLQRNSAAATATVLLGLTAVLLAPSTAHASRLPADPIITFVATPLEQARLVADAHAANVWAALEDLRAGR